MKENKSLLENVNNKFTGAKERIETLVQNLAILPTRTKLLILLLLGNGVNVSAKELDKDADALFLNGDTKIENVLNEDALSNADNTLDLNEANFNFEALQDTIKSLGTEEEEPYWSNSSINDIGNHSAITGYTYKKSNEQSLSLTNTIKNLINKWHLQFPDQIGTAEEVERAHQEYYNSELKPNAKNYKFDFGRGEKIENPSSSKNYVYLTVPLSYLYIKKSSSASGEVKDYNNSISNLSADVFIIFDKNLERIIWVAPDGCGNASILGYLEITEVKPKIIETIVKDTVYTPKDTVYLEADCPEPDEEIIEPSEGFSFKPKVEVGIGLCKDPDRILPGGVSIWFGHSGANSRSVSVNELSIEGPYKFHLSYDGKTPAPEFSSAINGNVSYDLGTTKPTYVLVEHGDGKVESIFLNWNNLQTDDEKKKGETLENYWLDKKSSDLGPKVLVNLGAEIRHSDLPGWYSGVGVSSSIYPNDFESTSFNAYLEAGKDFELWERDGEVGLRFYSPSIGANLKNSFEPGSWGIKYGLGLDANYEVLKGVKLGLELIYTKGNDNKVNFGNTTFDIKGEDKWNLAFKFVF